MDSSHNDSGGIQEKELDLYSILQANQSISEEIELDRLLQTMISVVVKNAGAESGLLLLPRNGELWIEAKLDNLLAEPVVNQSLPLDEEQLATRVVRFVARSKERVVLDDASQSEQFANDPYIAKQHTRSLLCSPLLKHNRLVGILYLENNKAPYIFTERRCVVLDMLSSQIAVSVDNARLYANLEGKVAERTEKLEQALQELKTKHQQLQEAQVHLVQSEKMASLGTLVAGVAHELNNPCSYSYTGANLLKDRLQGFKDLLFNMLDSQSEPDIVEMFDKEFERMFGNLEPIIDGTSQIRKIVEGLKAFSRLDEAEFKYAQIVDNLKATISIIEANYRRQVNFVCEFDVEPELECWPAQLNQAFINVMLNAVQAIMMKQKKVGLVDTGAGVVEKGTIRIRTFAENGHWGIQFVDDGCGMSEKIKSRIFEPFFTTRAVGEGAGLGLSITFGIINKHNGSIAVESEPGKGTAFTIYLPKEISA